MIDGPEALKTRLAALGVRTAPICTDDVAGLSVSAAVLGLTVVFSAGVVLERASAAVDGCNAVFSEGLARPMVSAAVDGCSPNLSDGVAADKASAAVDG